MKTADLRLPANHRFRAKLSRLMPPVSKDLPPGSIEFTAEFSTDQAEKPISWSSLLPHLSVADVDYAEVVDLFDLSLDRRVEISEASYQEIENGQSNSSQELQLLRAAKERDLGRMTALLQSGADPNARSHDGWTPLLEAALHGAETVAVLLRSGADPNLATPKGYTALMRAAGHGRTAVVKALVQAGAEILARDYRGVSACEIAIAEKRWETAAELACLLASSLERDAGAQAIPKEYVPLDEAQIAGLIGMSIRAVGGVIRRGTAQPTAPFRIPSSGLHGCPAGAPRQIQASSGLE